MNCSITHFMNNLDENYCSVECCLFIIKLAPVKTFDHLARSLASLGMDRKIWRLELAVAAAEVAELDGSLLYTHLDQNDWVQFHNYLFYLASLTHKCNRLPHRSLNF